MNGQSVFERPCLPIGNLLLPKVTSMLKALRLFTKEASNRIALQVIGLVVVFGVLLNLLVQETMLDAFLQQSELNNVSTVRIIENGLWADHDVDFYELAETTTAALDGHDAIARIHEATLALMRGTTILKVKVYDLSGRVIFSTQASQIGDDKSENAGVIAALEGGVASELSRRDRFHAFEQEVVDRDLVATYAPVRDATGAIIAVVEVYDDVTPLLAQLSTTGNVLSATIAVVFGVLAVGVALIVRHGNRTIAAHRDEAERASRAKSEFLASMSHELRTPLNTVIGFAEIIEDETLGPIEQRQYVEYAGYIKDGGRHLLSLVNDVLDLAKIEAGKFTLDCSVIDLRDSVSEVARILKESASRRGVEILVSSCEAPASAWADQRSIRQILINLMSNAIKFTTDGGSVRLSVAVEGQAAIIRVKDTGTGIPADFLERIFEPFVQVDGASTTVTPGTGLGPAIGPEPCPKAWRRPYDHQPDRGGDGGDLIRAHGAGAQRFGPMKRSDCLA